MLVLSFEKPKGVYEIRDGIIDTCRTVAEEFDLNARFEQPMQAAFTGRRYDDNRVRIGNGKHNNWFIEYQKEPLNTNIHKRKVVGQLFIRSPYLPAQMQFGGFSYEPDQTYSYVSIHLPSELGITKYSHQKGEFAHLDPEPELLDLTYDALKNHFGLDHPTLLDMEPTIPLPPR